MKLIQLTEQNIMLEMANLPPRATGINYVMFFGEVGGQHGPRIKVSNTKGKFDRSNNFTISVSKDPEIMTPTGSVSISKKEFNKIKKWIILNYSDLMLLWQILETGDEIELSNGEFLGVGALLSRLKKI